MSFNKAHRRGSSDWGSEPPLGEWLPSSSSAGHGPTQGLGSGQQCGGQYCCRENVVVGWAPRRATRRCSIRGTRLRCRWDGLSPEARLSPTTAYVCPLATRLVDEADLQPQRQVSARAPGRMKCSSAPPCSLQGSIMTSPCFFLISLPLACLLGVHFIPDVLFRQLRSINIIGRWHGLTTSC